jgi:hypothetical protein
MLHMKVPPGLARAHTSSMGMYKKCHDRPGCIIGPAFELNTSYFMQHIPCDCKLCTHLAHLGNADSQLKLAYESIWATHWPSSIAAPDNNSRPCTSKADHARNRRNQQPLLVISMLQSATAQRHVKLVTTCGTALTQNANNTCDTFDLNSMPTMSSPAHNVTVSCMHTASSGLANN